MTAYKCRRCQQEVNESKDIPYGVCKICAKDMEDDSDMKGHDY